MSRSTTVARHASLLTSVQEGSEEERRQSRNSERGTADACPLCFGTGMEVSEGKGARKCACRAGIWRERLFEEARIPRRHASSSFASYRPAKGNASQLRAFNLAFRLVREYPAVERGLLFAGPVGVGKTHLSVAILRGLIEKGVPCLFYEYGTLLKEIQESYNSLSQTSESSVLLPVYRAEVLVLDELGASKPTDWVLDTTAQIIGRRYNDKKLTIFTTNYCDVRQTSSDETLQDRIGTRLRSRLYEMCRTVPMDGEDYRRHFDEDSEDESPDT